LNVTVPTPLGLLLPVTVAVNVTGSPYVLGITPTVRATVVVVVTVVDCTANVPSPDAKSFASSLFSARTVNVRVPAPVDVADVVEIVSVT
jgi:hypothetical protein